ncbi:MAG: thioredoxin domain-containing protein, partial [Gemmatimonadota bacterium]
MTEPGPETSRDSPLASSRSPFLRHGAEQPVAWLPWGAEAFERARSEERPVLLDIGAVWCHWCHVMDRESYEDPDTAALINELYIPVKVDRDERPDVDARYQRAVQSLIGVGGWPLTAFLTPDGEVFHGGTYFPPEPAHGRPSFRRVLEEVARVWREEQSRVRELAGAVG